MRYIISEQHSGLLLRTYLYDVVGLSRRHLSHLKQAEDGMLLNGRRVTVRAVLHAGDELCLGEDETANENVVPKGEMPPVLCEDEHLLICNKSGDMPTHPSLGHFDDTLANAVAAYDLSRALPPHVFRPITRLDRETSGVVLIARTPLAATKLSEQMREHRIQKTYLAILEGAPKPYAGQVERPIRRKSESIILREVCDEDAEGAQYALTHYCVLATWPHGDGRRSLVRATPTTGRTHQLRLHFAHLGTPIVGDGLYGLPAPDAARQCLHAHTLRFEHPLTGEVVNCVAPLHADMARLLPADVLAMLDEPQVQTKGD